MLHELWVGRAGTGKSRRIAEQIAEEVKARPIGPKIWWVVPDAASFAAERLLLEHVPATIRAEVVTFHRLADRLSSETFVGQAQPINQTGQRLLLAHILQGTQSTLQVLGRARPSLSFLDSVLHAFEELTEHLVSMEVLQSTLEIASARVGDHATPEGNAGRRLIGKLHDLCTLYFLYQRELQNRNLVDPLEHMVRMTPHVPSAASVQGVHLYIDGFRELTPRVFSFARRLAEQAERVVWSVTADPSWIRPAMDRPDDVFSPHALRLCLDILHAYGEDETTLQMKAFPQTATPVVGRPPSPLQYLEQSVISARRDAWSDAVGGDRASGSVGSVAADRVTLAGAQNIRAEVDGVLRDILRRVEKDEIRFRDILLVVPNLETYAPHLAERGLRYGVPMDVAVSPSLSTYPLARFLLNVLSCVDTKMSTEAVIRLLKTDFCPISTDDADWLEQYLVQYGVDGLDAWTETWHYAAMAREETDASSGETPVHRDDERANRLRNALADVLLPAVQGLQTAIMTPQQLAEHLWALLQAVHAKRKVASWLVAEDAGETSVPSGVHEQAWQKLMRVFNDLATTLPTAELPRGFLFQCLREDIRTETLPSVPAALNSVQVLDVTQASGYYTPCAYVIGVVDGVLPRRVRSAGLIQDDERAQFTRLFGQTLGDTAEDRQLEERWRIYAGLTRGWRWLTVSYPMASQEGRELRPSSVIGRMRDLLGREGLSEVWWQTGDTLADVPVLTPNLAREALLGVIRDGVVGQPLPPGTTNLTRWFLTQRLHGVQLWPPMQGLFHTAKASTLPVDFVTALYGDTLRMNAYQLETVASCAYKHYLQYGLRLKEPEQADVSARERGVLIHDLLAAFVETQRQDMEAWRGLTDDEAMKEMEGLAEALLAAPVYRLWHTSSTRRQQAREAVAMAKKASVVLTRHARHSRFVPYRQELAFGTGEDALPPYRLDIGDGVAVELRGRLDRVDVAEESGDHWFRIIDYKSRVMKVDLARIYHGLSLQLALYSAVIRRNSEALFGRPSAAAGFFYLPLVRKLETGNQPVESEKATETAYGRMKSRGLWLGDPDVIGMMDSQLAAGKTNLFPAMLKQNGDFRADAPVLGPDDWAEMEAFVLQRVGELARQVLEGDIGIRPYALSRADRACNTCAFAAVCQIDTRWDGRPLRWLDKLDREEALSRLRTSGETREPDQAHGATDVGPRTDERGTKDE